LKSDLLRERLVSHMTSTAMQHTLQHRDTLHLAPKHTLSHIKVKHTRVPIHTIKEMEIQNLSWDNHEKTTFLNLYINFHECIYISQNLWTRCSAPCSFVSFFLSLLATLQLHSKSGPLVRCVYIYIYIYVYIYIYRYVSISIC